MEAAIQGMLDNLDEHSNYLPPMNYEDLVMSTEGEFGGLGITINIRDHYPTVVSPIEGTPAYYMGIQGGDQIIEIEGESSKDFTSREAVKLLRGKAGTQVNITIQRPGVEVAAAVYHHARHHQDRKRALRLFDRRHRLHPDRELRPLHQGRAEGQAGRADRRGHERPDPGSALQSRRPAGRRPGRQRTLPGQGRVDRVHQGTACAPRTTPSTARRGARCTTRCPRS